jgi:uncharacterized protein YcfL
VRRSIRVILAVILASLLTACGVSSPTPSSRIVRQAIALQAAQTQQELSQQLRLELSESSKVVVGRIQVKSQEPIEIENLPSYRLKGTYDYRLKLAKQTIVQKNNPFEVYLQRQIEGKTWRLAQRQRGEDGSSWVTQLIEF